MKGVAVMAVLGLTACASTLPMEIPPTVEGQEPAPAPKYLGVQTMRLDDELVTFRVGIERPRAATDIDAYTDCAAAQYAQIRGHHYARRIRSSIDDRGSSWVADAVYIIANEKPLGKSVIDAKTTLADCKAQSIPVV